MSKYVVGVDLGGTNTKIGILTELGELVGVNSIKTRADRGAHDVIKRVVEEVERLLDENKISKSDFIGIGMGVPGPTDTNTGIVKSCPNLIGWENLDIGKILEERLGVPTRIGNDVNVITLGEAWQGAAKGYKRNVLGIALGTGIGGGIIIEGKLLSGITGAAGEIGHMKVVENGNLCGCGKKGCWETYASATGLMREAKSRLTVNKNNLLWELIEGDLEKLEAKHIFDAAKSGDKFSMDLVDFEVKYLALGIANLLNILNPEVVVIGGGIAMAGDILFEPLMKKIKKYALEEVLEGMEIVPAKLGNDAGIYGAAALLFVG